MTHDLSCHGASCCRSAAAVIEVEDYLSHTLAHGFTDVDDSVAINEALECAASRSRDTVLRFAPGRYLLRTPIRPRSSSLLLTGPATLVTDPCNPQQLPGAIQVSDGPIEGMTIRGFRIELRDGPRMPPSDPRATSNSGIQLNRCFRCAVQDVEITYVGREPPECKPYGLDGITFAMGSFGLVRHVRITGVPKVGIYAASLVTSGPLVIENVEVRECDGPLGATGIAVGASDVTIREAWSHHHVLHPFPRADSLPESGGGLLIATHPAERGRPPAVPRHVRVEQSRFEDNGGHGVLIASPSLDVRPLEISLVDVAARRNNGNGVRIEAGKALLLAHVEASGNGYQGIGLTTETHGSVDPAARLSGVTILDALVYDNGAHSRHRVDPAHPHVMPGIGVLAVHDVTIVRGRFYRTEGGPSTQYTPVGIYPASGTPCNAGACVQLSAWEANTPMTVPVGARVDFRIPTP